MKLNLLLFIMLPIAMSPYVANAQDTKENSTSEKYKYAIGAGAGFATGYGLSFRYIPKRFGAQVNFAPYKTSEIERYSVGATLLYMVIESKISNLFIYQANHYYYNSETITVYNPSMPNSEEKVRTTDSYFNNGLGFGIEIVMVKRISLNLMAGYAFYNNFSQLNVTGEMALYYKF